MINSVGNGNSNNKRYCLVATSDEEFWNLEDPLVFLDGGCLKYSQRSKLLNNSYIIDENVWLDQERYKHEYDYLRLLRNRVTDQLMEDMNRIHNISYDKKSISILIGWWIDTYLGGLLYRYLKIKLISERLNIYVVGTDDTEQSVPYNQISFQRLLTESDVYNALLAERICRYLNIPVVKKNIPIGEEITKLQCNDSQECHNNIISWWEILKKIRNWASSFGKCIIYDDNVAFEKKSIVKLIFRRAICFRDAPVDRVDYTKYELSDSRKELLSNFDAQCEFEEMLVQFIKIDFPIAYVEAFDEIRRMGYRHFGKNRKALYAINAWFNDDITKGYLALERGNGLKLYGIQHGGTAVYRGDVNDIDTRCTDVYYTWGWKRKGYECDIRPFASPKLSDACSKKLDCERMNKVLYVGTAEPRYIRGFRYPHLIGCADYVQHQIDLLGMMWKVGIPIEARFHPNSFIWEIDKQLNDLNISIPIQDNGVPWVEAAQRYRICLFDIMMTSWTEAYVLGTPVIFLGEVCFEDFYEDAISDIDELKRVGVYHNSMEELVEYMLDIWDVIEEWWKEPSRVQAVSTFAQKYTMHSLNYREEWTDEIVRNLRI